MKLGTFSVSLAVKDIKASRAFYEKLGFSVIAGEEAQNWLVLRSDEAKIGLFQGMFEQNVLTFNPDSKIEDIRSIQADLKAKGVTITKEVEADSGPGHLTLLDPDGNPILIDQF